MSGLYVNAIDGYAMSAGKLDAIKQVQRLRGPLSITMVVEKQIVGQPQVVSLREVTQSSIIDELMEIADRRIHQQFAVYDQASTQPRVDVKT